MTKVNPYHALILFFVIHSFYIYPPLSSSFLAPVFFIIASMFSNNGVRELKQISNRKAVYIVPFATVAMLTTSLVIIFLHRTFDLSYIQNFISQLIQYSMILLISVLIFKSKRDGLSNFDYAMRLLVYIFAIQSIVQVLAFLFPPVANIVHLTYRESAVERLYEGYDGIRGLALTGSPGWGISVGYGFSFVIFTYHYIIKNKLKISGVFVGLLLILGTFFSGRSGFVGLILAAVMFLISKNDIKNKFMVAVKLLGVTLGLVASIVLLFPNIADMFVTKVFPFVFELFLNFSDSGKMESKSTNMLFEMWNIDIQPIEYLVGTGYFTDPVTGAYFRSVDVGLLRNILYGGIFWVVLNVGYHISFFCSSKQVKLRTSEYQLYIFLFILVFIFEMKAMTIGYNKYAFSILVFLLFGRIFDSLGRNNVK